MKKLLYLIIFIYTSSSIYAQAIWTAQESTPNMQANMFINMGVDPSGYVYTINETQSNISFYVMYRFFAYNTNGEKIWEYANDSCFTDCIEKYHCVLPINGDGVLFIGYREDLTSTNHLLFKRFNAAGQLLWVKDWITAWAGVNPVQAKWDNNGNAVVSVQSYFVNPSETAIGFVILDTATQNIIQQPVDMQNANAENTCLDFEIGKNNLIYGCGNGMGNSYVFKIDSSGNFIKTFLPDDQLGLTSYNNIALDDEDNVTGIGVFGNKAVLGKYNSVLNQQWIKTLQEDTLQTSGVDVLTDNDNNIYALCNFSQSRLDSNSFSQFSFDNSDYFIQKFSTDGSLVWNHKYFENMDSAVIQSSSTPIAGAIQMLLCGDKIDIISNDQIDTLSSWKLIKNTIDLNGNTIQHFIENSDLMNEWQYINGYAKRNFILADNNCNIYTSYSTSNGTVYQNITRKYGSTSTKINNYQSTELDVSIAQYPDYMDIFLSKVSNNTIVKLYDATGRCLSSKVVNEKHSTIYTNDLAKGIYIIHVYNNTGSFSKKISLQ